MATISQQGIALNNVSQSRISSWRPYVQTFGHAASQEFPTSNSLQKAAPSRSTASVKPAAAEAVPHSSIPSSSTSNPLTHSLSNPSLLTQSPRSQSPSLTQSSSTQNSQPHTVAVKQDKSPWLDRGNLAIAIMSLALSNGASFGLGMKYGNLNHEDQKRSYEQMQKTYKNDDWSKKLEYCKACAESLTSLNGTLCEQHCPPSSQGPPPSMLQQSQAAPFASAAVTSLKVSMSEPLLLMAVPLSTGQISVEFGVLSATILVLAYSCQTCWPFSTTKPASNGALNIRRIVLTVIVVVVVLRYIHPMTATRYCEGYQPGSRITSEQYPIATCEDRQPFVAVAERQSTFDWVFSNPDFLKWRKNDSDGVFWLKGNPGAGKTTLAKSLIECMKMESRDPHGSTTFWIYEPYLRFERVFMVYEYENLCSLEDPGDLDKILLEKSLNRQALFAERAERNAGNRQQRLKMRNNFRNTASKYRRQSHDHWKL